MADYKELSDAELVGLLRASDDAAFIEIFNRYSTLLFSFTYRRLKDKEISKYLVHE
jgi:RNA polymerase sigma-70 factor (ECF subfamily)